ncbi:NUDIX domain-containing protein [Streptomyces sp. NPDC020800]|uniref:NUDIX domain-containing protein n=1 Tax=Streptomyces sp. NPDC020800 TaxID=3365092 RepID=UPI0037A6F0B0
MTRPDERQDTGSPPVLPRGKSDRQAVRVVCYDRSGRVLLLRWNLTGLPYWEPPGGGVEPGESPLDAARRELAEETGLPAHSVVDHYITVARDFAWFGTPCPRVERFFAAVVPEDEPEIRPSALTRHESSWLVGQGWFYPEQIPLLADHVEPPHLLRVIARLDGGRRL